MRKGARGVLSSLLLAGLALAAAPVHAETAGAIPAAAPAPASEWSALAVHVVGEAELWQTTEQVLEATVAQIAKSPDIAQLETAYPGMLAAFSEALRPIMRSEAELVLPLYRADLTSLYKETLSAAEARQVLAFMQSPPMLRFRAELGRNRNLSATARDLAAENDISQASMHSDLRSSAIQAALKMDSADLKVIAAFYATPLGGRFAAINPRKMEIDRKWSNYISPEAEAKVERVVLDAMVAHVAKTDARVAEAMRKELAKGPHGGAN